MSELMQVKQDGSIEPVITLRDRFAMAALTGLIASAESAVAPEEYAEAAFRIADAMVEAGE